MFWLSYEFFSILCDVFLVKSDNSSHNSCDVPLTELVSRKSFVEIEKSFGTHPFASSVLLTKFGLSVSLV